MTFSRWGQFSGILKLPNWGESNLMQSRMVILRDFPFFLCIVWVGNMMTPVLVRDIYFPMTDPWDKNVYLPT